MSMWNKPQPDDALKPDVEALAAIDPDLARAYATCGLPLVRKHQPGFAGLMRIITAQQVSASAARAIVARLEDAVRPLSPERFLTIDEPTLRAIGLSGAKIAYARALARDILEGVIDLDGLTHLDDEDAIRHLCQAKGIGRWSAEIYLLFALRRPDVMPAGDLAVRSAFQRLKRLRRPPSEEKLLTHAEPWRPYRSAAARLLWHYYAHAGVTEGGAPA